MVGIGVNKQGLRNVCKLLHTKGRNTKKRSKVRLLVSTEQQEELEVKIHRKWDDDEEGKT